jgi:hypothetical protein
MLRPRDSKTVATVPALIISVVGTFVEQGLNCIPGLPASPKPENVFDQTVPSPDSGQRSFC